MLDDPTPTAAAPAALYRLNASSLEALRALDPSGGGVFVRRVLETYLRSMDKHVEVLRGASASGDLLALRAVAHTLKSSSNSVGALAFAQSSAQLETVLRERLEQPAAGADVMAGLTGLVDRYLKLAEQVRLAVLAELDDATP